MNYKKRIEEIVYCAWACHVDDANDSEYYDGIDYKPLKKGLVELLWDFSEELIGEDEKDNFALEEIGGKAWQRMSAENQLRAEQRKKVKKLLGRKHE